MRTVDAGEETSAELVLRLAPSEPAYNPPERPLSWPLFLGQSLSSVKPSTIAKAHRKRNERRNDCDNEAAAKMKSHRNETQPVRAIGPNQFVYNVCPSTQSGHMQR